MITKKYVTAQKVRKSKSILDRKIYADFLKSYQNKTRKPVKASLTNGAVLLDTQEAVYYKNFAKKEIFININVHA